MNRGKKPRQPSRTVLFVLGLIWLVLSAVGLGFLLGLARPRHDAAGRPRPDGRRW